MLMFSSDLFISVLTLPHSGGGLSPPKLIIPGNVLVDFPEVCPLADSRSREVGNLTVTTRVLGKLLRELSKLMLRWGERILVRPQGWMRKSLVNSKV